MIEFLQNLDESSLNPANTTPQHHQHYSTTTNTMPKRTHSEITTTAAAESPKKRGRPRKKLEPYVEKQQARAASDVAPTSPPHMHPASSKPSSGLLHQCAKDGQLKDVRCLVESGAEINAKNDEGMTPLHVAADYGHLDVVKYLIRKGADVNVRNDLGWAPLHSSLKGLRFNRFGLAARKFEVVRALIEAGADVNSQISRTQFPLSICVHNGTGYFSMDAARLLIKAGANVRAKTFHHGNHIEVRKALWCLGIDLHDLGYRAVASKDIAGSINVKSTL